MNSIIKHKFDNGLRLVYQERKETDISSISIFVNVGSVYETNELNGVSHFIEHMMFKGTPKLKSSKEISKIFDSIGAYFNAYTDKNVTCYIVKTSSDYLEKSLNTLSDMLLNSIMDKIEFEKEKKVVVEEINKAKDNTESIINDLIFNLIFKGLNLAKPVGGKDDEILNYDYNKTIEYVNYFYRPENMVISVCSNISFKKICNIVNSLEVAKKKGAQYSKLLLKNNHKKFTNNNKLLKQKLIRLSFINRDLEQTHIAFGFRTCNIYNPDVYYLDILKIILAGNMSSRLFIELREKNGLTYNVSIDNSEYIKSGLFCILTSVDKHKLIKYYHDNVDMNYNLKKNIMRGGKKLKHKKGALPLIINSINKLLKDGITQEELDKAKGFIKGTYSLEVEDALNITDYNGKSIILDKKKLISINELYRLKYKNITVSQINKVIKKYFKVNNLSVIFIGKDINKLENISEIKTEITKLSNFDDSKFKIFNLKEYI